MLGLKTFKNRAFLSQTLAAFRKANSRRDQETLNPLLGRIGSLEVRLATTRAELRAAQRLRYQVFFDEMSARGKAITLAPRRDVDPFDAYCDHLIVIDNEVQQNGIGGVKAKIIGTYRLLRQEVAQQNDGFYSANEYDLVNFLDHHKNMRFLELGRSCVMKEYRTKRTVELLWHGIWAYVLHHKIDVMFGCASLEGTDIAAVQEQLSFLSQLHDTPKEWQVRAHENHYVPMKTHSARFSKKQALSSLPPLIKGYLRLGAYIGEGAVVDHDFGTTDVLIILPVENINPRYISHYGESAGRYAA